jgi:parvulin-like peptidyl-prolyl isomerase
MKTKRQTPESQEFMLQLTRELVDRDIDRIVEERLQEKIENAKQKADEKFSAIKLKTKEFKFNKDIANER